MYIVQGTLAMYMGRNCVEETGTVWERQELNERERNCVGETRTAREKNKLQ